MYDELWNQGNLAIVDELMAADFVDHNPDPGQPPGPEGWKQSATVSRTGFPDLQVTIEDMVAEGDRVTLRLQASGTHTGEFAGMPPTGNQIAVGWIDVVRVEDDKIAERWGQFDALGFFTQLGLIPPLEEIAALQAENQRLKEIAGPPPASLDKLYPPEAPAPLFAIGMLEMDSAGTAAIADLFQGDVDGAVANWDQFKQKYVEVSQMVPEWTDRFPTEFLDAGDEALKAGDVEGFFAALELLEAVCGGCHVANQSNVQYKYWWPDFGQVMVDDPISQEQVPFGEHMFTVANFLVGIGNDLGQGQMDNALEDYQGFKAAFSALAEACNECHDTPREYFVDARVQADIDALGKALQAESPDAEAIGGLLQKIGGGSCGGCHMVHKPAALARDRWEMAQPSGK